MVMIEKENSIAEIHKQVFIRKKVSIATAYGDCFFYTFNNFCDNKEHLALVYKNVEKEHAPLVRVHSECLTGDIFGSEKCDCGDQLGEAMRVFSQYGGIILYLRQEGRGIGLYNKLDAYSLQNEGFDTFEANQLLNFPDDMRSYTVAAQMLKALNINRIRLVTNNNEKVRQIEESGISIVERISTGVYLKEQNQKYLLAKKCKSEHQFSLSKNLSNYFSKECSI